MNTGLPDRHKLVSGILFPLLMLVCGIKLWGQAAPANSLSTPAGTNVSATQLAVPGGAGANATTSGNASAGPILGFQVWQQDRFFLASFFTLAVPQTFTGQPPLTGQTLSPQQSSFGALVLNPPGQGTSYSFTGNKMIGVYTGKFADKKFYRRCTDCTVDDANFFFGFEARAGITNETWTEATATPTSVNGSVAFLVPEFLLTSKTYNFVSGGGSMVSGSAKPAKTSGGSETAPNCNGTNCGTQNQYQFGVAVGPSFRYIGGDIAQSQNAALLTTLLGTNKTYLHGLEFTFFVRMNQFKPYVRFTNFKAPNGSNIPSFSGTQFNFGIDVLSALFHTTVDNADK